MWTYIVCHEYNLPFLPPDFMLRIFGRRHWTLSFKLHLYLKKNNSQWLGNLLIQALCIILLFGIQIVTHFLIFSYLTYIGKSVWQMCHTGKRCSFPEARSVMLGIWRVTYYSNMKFCLVILMVLSTIYLLIIHIMPFHDPNC